jgi:cell division protein FtsB
VTGSPRRRPDATAPSVARSSRRAPAPIRALASAVAGIGRAVRGAWVEARSGERPLLVVLLAAIVLAVVMLSGPFERYADGRTRVEATRSTAEALDEEIARLEARVEQLEDPANLEQLAREQQGMIRPGEVAYTLVPPEVDRPVISAPRGSDAGEPTPPWYARAWDSVRSWF